MLCVGYTFKTMKKYEVATHTREDYTYGIWNTDMQAWRFVYDWNGTQTVSLDEANRMCEILNKSIESNEYSNRDLTNNT